MRLVEAIDSVNHVYLVMEYVQGSSLHEYMKAQPSSRLAEDAARSLIRQLLSILCYMHERGVSHRDSKLENIIIDKQGVIKLIDFGFCCS